jgi:hypothetical protein
LVGFAGEAVDLVWLGQVAEAVGGFAEGVCGVDEACPFWFVLGYDVLERLLGAVAMPSDLPLDTTFVGVLGSKQYQFRDNPDPVAPLPSNRVDAAGVLQWRASRLLAGETLRVNLYYDTFRSFAR